MILVEPRAVTHWYHEWIAVLVALLLTVATTSALLASLGLDPMSSFQRIFIRPLNSRVQRTNKNTLETGHRI